MTTMKCMREYFYHKHYYCVKRNLSILTSRKVEKTESKPASSLTTTMAVTGKYKLLVLK